jgi:peptidoglycan/LPS O-acetylase OafA/YrhL
MAIIQAPPLRTAPAPAGPAPAGERDAGIDLIRAVCVALVVLLHALMVGVTVDPAGPVFENAADGAPWFPPLTWALQVMPLFFVIGGFSGATAFRRFRARGGTRAEFVAGRVRRLLLPAVVSTAAVAAALAALGFSGVAPDLVAIAGFRYAQPLWFLGVYLLCQALLPVLHAAHERAPARTILALVAAAVSVDALRAVSGVEGIGFLNLAFVWLALQQLGFLLADGRIDALARRARVAAAMGAVALLAALFLAGVYSPDLIANLNPPTAVLLLVGVAQTAVLSLMRHRIERFSARRTAAAFTRFVTARTMTIYLWHMPLLLVMAGASVLASMATGIALPEPSSAGWWATRPLWVAVVVVLTAGVAAALAGIERHRTPPAAVSPRRTVQAVLLGLAAVVLLLAAGTTVVTAAIASAAILFALVRIRPLPGGRSVVGGHAQSSAAG